MTRTFVLAACAAAVAAALATPVQAQGVPQTLALTKIDPATLATGWRTTKIVGAAVVGETGEKIGTVDDLIVTADGKVPYAVLSVGGFLGVGTHYVVVLASALEVKNRDLRLPGATRESLRLLPGYLYAE
ncbi:PRC-barrel domain containing protein [Siculibacillus lacustris]|uniref:PRC-barrel domain containing protein n=1 Tax=Siculibacillus lacustris TaxID=1549641 RepID=A0A4Q9VVI7_9HYPH|nr:PRC-barrel domain-containing protein [Siculibacillus lacustris]TBW40286.1 PRC-barrel domain containing protein [Siculibacillus lacustris]